MIDKKNLLLIVFVLLIVGIVGIWIPNERSKQNPNPVTSTESAEVKVTYTPDGFKPEKLNVPVGTTVAWENRSGRPMWVGSDPHPAHTNLPGFDQLRIINRVWPSFVKKAYAHGDAIYEYTFNKVGEWKYHNHVYPAHRGTVIVVER